MASTAKARPRSTAPSCPSPSILARAHHAAAPPAVADVLGRPGRPLAPETRASMEPRLGRDFSDVRLHDDAAATASARAISARAYNAGARIVLDGNRVDEHSREGRGVLAHELTHVAQQPPGAAAAGPPAIAEHPAREAEASTAAAAIGEGRSPAPVAQRAEAGAIQRLGDETAANSLAGAAAGSGAAGGAGCIEAVAGEDPSTLTEAGTLTIVEFGATWCTPCKTLKANLEAMCQGFATAPPKAPVRIFSIDIDEPGNEEIAKRYAVGPVPHLYFYVGHSQRDYYNSAIQPDVLEVLVAQYADEASQSDAWKGAKKGGFWGGLAGLGLGIAGAVAVGTSSGLEGNALMGGILGSIGGGIAAGALVGGGIGALAGWLGSDKKGSRRKKKKQPLRRSGAGPEREEIEADALAVQALRQPGSTPRASGATQASAASMDTALRADMESRFGRDFSRVRLHRDAGAQRIADGMDAFAVTEGADIYFARDGYAPGTPAGRAILAHELAHVAQQDSSAPAAAAPVLEADASRAAAQALRGAPVGVEHAAGGDTPPLPLTRTKKTLLGGGIGLVGGAAAGALVGLGVAALMKDSPYGLGAGIGAVIGAGVGLIAGLITGYVARRTHRVGAQEADMLIRRRYGRYMPGGVPAPLRNALVLPVSSADLCERIRCRRPGASCSDVSGWTDTGVPWRGGSPPANPIASPADEPVCNGKQMEHATHQRPVIYFQRDTADAGILVHEGLHAISHESFQGLLNVVNEGTTELYTRRILADVNIAVQPSVYDRYVPKVERFEGLVGEEPLARAYFAGDLRGLDRAAAAIFGPCSLEKWAFALEMNHGESLEADAVIAGRGVNHCFDGASSVFSAAAPVAPGDGEGDAAHRAGGGASGGGAT